jgi:NAD(P)-dependent dehydrogenase (short-subunit alcohol dehydrogenase family)
MAPPLDLSSRVVLVTGGTRGIGAAIATAFLDAGAEVTVCGRIEPDQALRGERGEARFVAADVRDPDQAAALVDRVVERDGQLDLVVNNAGGGPPVDAARMSPKLAASVVGVNLLAPFYVAQRANAVMQGQVQGGSIVNVGSVSALRPAPGTAVYSAAKAGLAGLTRALALEWGPKVRVNQLTVGLVETDGSAEHYGGPAGLAAAGDTVPLGRMARPEDVAQACLLLASPLAAFISGAELRVDGGGERPGWLVAVERAVADGAQP